MLHCLRSSGVRGVVTRSVVVMAVLGARAQGADILEIRGLTLTNYPGATTAEQGILPLHDQRGTGIDGSLRSGSPMGWGVAGNPFGEPSGGQQRWGDVRLDLGAYAPTDIDLSLPAQGAGRWTIGRTFNSRQASASNGVQGRNWMQTSQPELVRVTGIGAGAGDDTLLLVYGADRYLEFQRTGSSSNEYKGKNGAAGMMQYVSGSPDTFIYYLSDGTRVWFFGGNTSSNRANWQLWKIADAAGNTAYVGDLTTASTAVTSGYDANGNLTTAYDDFGPHGRRYTYTYTTLDSVARLTRVKAEVLTGGTWASPSGTTEVGRVDYDYYQTGGTTYGDIGCLKTVSITTPLTDSGVSVTRTKAYRYWTGSYDATTNPGHPYEIQYVVDYEGYRAADWADSTFDGDPLTMTETSLKPYAAAYFEYDSSGRIKKAWTNGQCGCAGGSGNGVHEFTYDDNSLSTKIANTSYDTSWGQRTVMKQPDGTYVVQYFDETGAPLSRVLVDGDPASSVTNRWATEVIRNSDGQISEVRTPEANTGYTHTGGSAGTFTASSSVGLIRVYDRVGSGATKGFIEAEKVKKGTGGTVEYEHSRTYSSRELELTSGNNVMRPVLTASRVFHTTTTNPADSTKYDETGHSYGWADTTNTNLDYIVLKRSTTTLATASTGKNGSNVSTQQERYYRKDGSVAYQQRTQISTLSGTSGDRKYSYTKMEDGLVKQSVQDADVDDTGKYTGTDDPTQAGWSINLSNMAGLDLTENRTYDAQGRLDETALPTTRTAKMYYSRLADHRLVTISIPKKSGSDLYGPASYTVTNHAGRVEAQGTIAFSGSNGETNSALTGLLDETDADPITAIDVGTLERLSTSLYDDAGARVEESRVYFNIPASGAGSDGTNYDGTFYAYDEMGRQTRVKTPTGDITLTAYDAIGRVTSRQIGTNDPDEGGSDNMVTVEEMEYDGNAVNGNGHLTKRTAYIQDNATDKRETSYLYDYRGRMIVTLNPQSPHTLMKYDNAGRSVAVGQYSSTSGLDAGDDPTSLATNRVALSESFYDELGRVWKTSRHLVDQSDGSLDNSLESYTWYDYEGRVAKVDGERLTKTQYDRLGRVVAQYTLASTDDSTYAHALDVTGDIVLEESRTGYDLEGRAVVRASIQRHHDDKGGGQRTGALDDNDGTYGDKTPTMFTAVDINGRIQITAMWYDVLDRVVDTVAYGTNAIVGDGSTSTGTFDRDGLSVPARSDTVLRTTTTFNKDGSVLETTDPKGLVTRYLYDDAGRKTAVIANYVNGTPSGTTGDDDVYTRFVFTDGLQTAYHVDEDGDGVQDAGEQVTTYTYGVTKGGSAGDSKIASGRLLQKVTYPDTETGESAADHEVSFAYNAQGQQIWTKDQSGNVIETDYDTGGRQTHRKVTTLASGFDGSVRRISTTYNSRGMTESVTQYDNATPGSGSAVNDVKMSMDGWGNLEKYEQDRDSLVGAGTPNDYEVSYLYDVEEGAGRNTIRRSRQTIAYAASTIEWLEYQYLSSSDRFDDDASRVTQLYSKDGVTYASYDYTGMSTVVGIEYPEPDVYRRLYGSSQGDYPDWDRFNRQVNSTWSKDLSTDVNFYDVDYSYDRNSNITWSEDNVYPGRDILYTMDGMNRLTDADEGSRSGGSITSRLRREQWTLQQVGNWDLFKLDLNGDGDWNDTNEVQDKGTFVTSGGTGFNELRGRDTDNNASVDITRVYDKNGNLTDDGLVYHYKYDAFNRLRKLIDRDDGTTLLHEYAYNGVGHRVGWWNFSDNQWVYFAYDEQWRMVGSYRATDTTPKELFINHQAGMGGTARALGLDACVARLKDASVSWTTTTDAVLEERVYYCQELRSGRADVVHLIDTAGARVESVRYSPYGVPFGIPYVDFNADGAKTSADQTLLTAATGYSAGSGSYNVACDINLDGTVDSADASLYSGYSGGTLGRGNMSRNIVRNRKGYAGYEHDGVVDNLMHVRHRVYESELGRWVQRDPLGFVDGANVYGYAKTAPVLLFDPSGAACGAAQCSQGSQTPATLPWGTSDPRYRSLCRIYVDIQTGAAQMLLGGSGEEHGNKKTQEDPDYESCWRDTRQDGEPEGARNCINCCYMRSNGDPIYITGCLEMCSLLDDPKNPVSCNAWCDRTKEVREQECDDSHDRCIANLCPGESNGDCNSRRHTCMRRARECWGYCRSICSGTATPGSSMQHCSYSVPPSVIPRHPPQRGPDPEGP